MCYCKWLAKEWVTPKQKNIVGKYGRTTSVWSLPLREHLRVFHFLVWLLLWLFYIIIMAEGVTRQNFVMLSHDSETQSICWSVWKANRHMVFTSTEYTSHHSRFLLLSSDNGPTSLSNGVSYRSMHLQCSCFSQIWHHDHMMSHFRNSIILS
jgi:hypothetical protein